MTTAMFRAMLLTLLNDRGALALAFLLPIVFFLIMAEIFSSATGVNMQLHVAFADEKGGELSRRLLDNLRANETIVVVGGPDLDRQQVQNLVGKGAADFGLIMRAGARRLDDVGGFGSPPILLINDPVRAVMVPMISGQIQKSYFDALPDVALASVVGLIEDQFVELDSEQHTAIDDGLAQMRTEALAGDATGWSFAEMIETQSVARQSASRNHVAYYAGAVAFLFLLFSSVQGAISLTEERQSGILERIMAGPGGMAVLVNGKFLFLLTMGCLQLLLIFTTAWILYGVDLPGHFGAWLVISMLASGAAAGISLFIAAICRTPGQARNLSTILVLIASAIGGSMVPRFFMPGWLRDLGWFTPNTWVLEAYSAVFWRDESLSQIVLPCALLGLFGLISLLGAQWFAARNARI
jgi:ABC-2 type transport system permease protein